MTYLHGCINVTDVHVLIECTNGTILGGRCPYSHFKNEKNLRLYLLPMAQMDPEPKGTAGREEGILGTRG